MTEPKRKALSEDQVHLIMKALGDPRRYDIVKRLSRRKEALPCEAVLGCMDISAPTLSHHMKELEIAGLVQAERKGKFVSYSLQGDVLEAFFDRLKRDLV
jgi:ArsR family transcriptional regulator